MDLYNAEGDDVVFIGLNIEETEANVSGYRDEFNVPYPLALNQDGALDAVREGHEPEVFSVEN